MSEFKVILPKSKPRDIRKFLWKKLPCIVLKSSAYFAIPKDPVLNANILRELKFRCSGMSQNYFSKKIEYTPRYSKVDIKGQMHYKVPLLFVFEEQIPYKKIRDLRKSPQSFPSRIQIKPDFKLRPHQAQIHPYILKKLHEFPYHACCIQKACGAGKTIQAAYTIGHLRVRTMICVPQNKIAQQFKEELQFVLNIQDSDIQLIGSQFSDPNPNAWIYICVYNSMRQTQNYSTKFSKIVQSMDFLIVDEAHNFPAQANTTILCNFRGKYRMGLTATPTRQSDRLGHMIFKLLGPLVAQVDRVKPPKGLYKATFLQYYNKDHTKVLYLPSYGGGNPNPNRAKMLTRLAEDPQRCKEIAEYLVQNLSHKHVLCLADWKCFVFQLRDEIEKLKPNSTFVYVGHGKLSKIKEEQEKQGLAHATFILATIAKAGEGMNIKRLNVVVYLTPRTPNRLLIQANGRMLRVQEPKHAYYIEDSANEYHRNKASRCKSWFRKEGFEITPNQNLNQKRKCPESVSSSSPKKKVQKFIRKRSRTLCTFGAKSKVRRV